MYILIGPVSGVQREGHSGEPAETLPIQEDFQGVHGGYKHVDAHVEFVAVYQQRVFDISLHNYRFAIGDLSKVINQ